MPETRDEKPPALYKSTPLGGSSANVLIRYIPLCKGGRFFYEGHDVYDGVVEGYFILPSISEQSRKRGGQSRNIRD